MDRVGRGLLAAAGGLGLAWIGCSGPRREPPAPQPIATATQPAEAHGPAANTPVGAAVLRPSRADEIRGDPAGFVRQVAANTERLAAYTCTMVREERRGIFGRVFGPERIACWFRQAPFSIRMKWLDPEVKYGESTFVADKPDAKVRFVARQGLFGLPPGITTVDVQTPVVWGEAKNPVTDFGLRRMMERTLASMAKAGDAVRVDYRGVVRLAPLTTPAHHLRLEYSGKEWKTPFHDLYVDVATELPAATILSLPDGQLDAAYYYLDLDLAARPGDADFLLDAEREKRTAPTTQPRKPRAALTAEKAE